ncbi:MAG: hypothetical protein ACI8XO_002518 [Verrucomicrobiales bacterium]|jgi:hypothetical protein
MQCNTVALAKLFCFAACALPAGAQQVVPRSPGVYVEELPGFPNSATAIPTSIPAFVGVTEKRPPKSPGFRQISSLREYESLFGKVAKAGAGKFGDLYASIKLFYENGGGCAYVYSVGSDIGAQDKAVYLAGLKALEKETEPAPLLFPDAVSLGAGG